MDGAPQVPGGMPPQPGGLGGAPTPAAAPMPDPAMLAALLSKGKGTKHGKGKHRKRGRK